MNDSGEWAKLPGLAPIVAGPIMAFALSFLQSLYDERESDKFKAVVGALICSFITVGVTNAVFFSVLIFDIKIPLPEEYQMLVLTAGSAGIGSFVGFLGVKKMSQLVNRFIQKILDIKITK